MPNMIAKIQTTWPKIRVGLYQREDGHFQYIEEGLQTDSEGKEYWFHYRESGLYKDQLEARAAMLKFYAYQVEDEYWVEPESVVILEAPDFEGPHHPVLHPVHPKP